MDSRGAKLLGTPRIVVKIFGSVVAMFSQDDPIFGDSGADSQEALRLAALLERGSPAHSDFWAGNDLEVDVEDDECTQEAQTKGLKLQPIAEGTQRTLDSYLRDNCNPVSAAATGAQCSANVPAKEISAWGLSSDSEATVEADVQGSAKNVDSSQRSNMGLACLGAAGGAKAQGSSNWDVSDDSESAEEGNIAFQTPAKKKKTFAIDPDIECESCATSIGRAMGTRTPVSRWRSPSSSPARASKTRRLQRVLSNVDVDADYRALFRCFFPFHCRHS